MNQIKEWYDGLDNDEQKIVKIAAVFFSLVILIFGIIKPLNKSVSELTVKVSARQRIVEQWRQAMPMIRANKGQASTGNNNVPLSTVITTSTNKFNLRVSRVQEKKNDEIQVWFDNVAFNDFLRWTVEIQDRYQVKITAVNVRSKNRDGLSSIDIKIRKG